MPRPSALPISLRPPFTEKSSLLSKTCFCALQNSSVIELAFAMSGDADSRLLATEFFITLPSCM
eukprot:CAMPEP_0179050744 /NCGR_PEP_ID=MMETSP0796-20121207/20888_1 /TAXON_ID=73915 /ORGANISM="Pyrodinium bahamense, Strain pbaha01" /LENGTH=63 /DNA_ID=CAMNT_0020747265 /DNA_START=12 /DNA_END=203 /DNA_ORIENTATION=-